MEKISLQFGDSVTETLVKKVADHIRTTLRQMDLLESIGADGRAVALPGITEAAARILGQRVRASIKLRSTASRQEDACGTLLRPGQCRTWR